jgi:hypothetical protein
LFTSLVCALLCTCNGASLKIVAKGSSATKYDFEKPLHSHKKSIWFLSTKTETMQCIRIFYERLRSCCIGIDNYVVDNLDHYFPRKQKIQSKKGL